MVDRDTRHRGINRVVVKRQILRVSRDHRGGVCRSLTSHGRAWLDGQHPAILRLVGPRAGSDVEHGLRVAQRPLDPLGDARIGLPIPGVAMTVLLVVNSRGHEEMLRVDRGACRAHDARVTSSAAMCAYHELQKTGSTSVARPRTDAGPSSSAAAT